MREEILRKDCHSKIKKILNEPKIEKNDKLV